MSQGSPAARTCRLDFPLCAQPDADARLRELVLECCTVFLDRFGEDRMQSLILMGTPARGEATAGIWPDGSLHLLSDVEIFAVAGDADVTQNDRQRAKSANAAASQRAGERGTPCEIEFQLIPRADLARLSARIFTLELKSNGKVIWGDPGVLADVRDVDRTVLPRGDALDLTSNRMVEHLDMRRRLATADATGLEEVMYWNGKLFLDLAASLLVFAGAYEPTYAGRCRRFGEVYPRLGPLPERLPDLPERVRQWTTFKTDPTPERLWGFDPAGKSADELRDAAATLWRDGSAYLREVWLWESADFLSIKPTRELDRLADAYLRADGGRTRGWAKLLLRPPGGARPPLGRALRLWLRGSPRRLIYLCAAYAYFAVCGDTTENDAVAFIRRRLPLPPDAAGSGLDCHVGDLIRNWVMMVK